MKLGIMRAMDVVREFVEHRVGDLLYGEKQAAIARISESKTNFVTTVHVEACESKACETVFSAPIAITNLEGFVRRGRIL